MAHSSTHALRHAWDFGGLLMTVLLKMVAFGLSLGVTKMAFNEGLEERILPESEQNSCPKKKKTGT
jgi:hypothetical protein